MTSLTSKLVRYLMRLLPLLPACASASDSDPVPQLPAPTTIGGAELLSLGTSLIVVVGAIVVVGWLYSRLQRNGLRANGVIDVVASKPVGPKERILLVDVAGKQLLIGMTSAQVQTLHVFEQPVAQAEAVVAESNFAKRLSTAIKGFTK